MTNYFSHDVDAHKDPKCSALIAEKGMIGYGIYWCLIEILHEQGGKIEKFPKLHEGLAFQLRIEVEQIEALLQALINDYQLLKEDEKYIWSDRVLRNLDEQEKKRMAKQEAGRIGGLNSGKSRNNMKQNEAVLEANEANEPKEKKLKEIKRKESIVKPSASMNYLLNVPPEDLKELSESYSCTESQVKSKGDDLFNYCESKGKRYSDYKAFLRNTLKKDFGYRKPTVQFNPEEVAPEISEEQRQDNMRRIQEIRDSKKIKKL